MAQIEEPKQGESTFVLWKTVVELVKAVNALQKIQLTPRSLGKVTYADGNVSIDFNTEKCQ